MAADRPTFFSRSDVLGGLPARRASTLLFAIEQRTAQLVSRSRKAMATWTTERAEAERERAFLDALAAGRTGARPPRVQDVERHAPAWAALVPSDPALRAAVVHLLAGKYRLPRRGLPRIRAALGMDEPAVRQAFERANNRSIDTVFVDRLTLREQLGWGRARLAERVEMLPAFWIAFGLTFTETVGVGMLGLPIALAGVSLAPALALLVAFGVVNIVTIAALCETITRDGNMRYGAAWFGRLVSDFLGRPGTAVLSVALVVFLVLVIGGLAIGFGSTLHAATGIPVPVWIGVLLLVDIAFLRRQSLDATIAFALLIGVINVGLLLLISLVALPHVTAGNLATPLPVGAAGTEGSLLALVFGVLMCAYFGHTSAATLAKVVLAKDPTGRDLVRGSVFAQAAAIGVYALFLAVTLGAVGRARLAVETGTPLAPLAEVAGPIVHVMGLLYVILAFGIGSIHFTLGLANQVREFLPSPAASGIAGALGRVAADPRGRVALAIAPSVAVYTLTTVQVLAGAASFSGALSIAGTIVVPILAGVFPMLMLASARRRGDYVPAVVPAWLGHPLVIGSVSAVFLAGPLVHAIGLWTGLPERFAAIAAVGLTLGAAILALRGGSFRPRTVVELRRDASTGDRARFTVTGDGRPLVSRVQVTDTEGTREIRSATGELGRFGGLRSADFELPPHRGRDLKVWVHGVDPAGGTTALPATVRLEVDGSGPSDHAISGELSFAAAKPASRVQVRFADGTGVAT